MNRFAGVVPKTDLAKKSNFGSQKLIVQNQFLVPHFDRIH